MSSRSLVLIRMPYRTNRQSEKTWACPKTAPCFWPPSGRRGDYRQRVAVIEQVFEHLKKDVLNGYFMIICPEPGSTSWIHFHSFLDKLYLYFAASDVVITQSGYGKVAELSALGIPFLAVPLDFHLSRNMSWPTVWIIMVSVN